MSKREDIASHIVSTIEAISSPSIQKVTRQPFNLEELAQAQYPAVLVQTQEETKEDQELGEGAKTRLCTLEFLVTGYIKGSESNIDTARNTLATAIETQLMFATTFHKQGRTVTEITKTAIARRKLKVCGGTI